MRTVLSSQEIENAINSGDHIKLVVITSDGCHWCDEAKDTLKSCKLTNQIFFKDIVIADADNCREWSAKFNVDSTPCLIIFDNSGDEVSRLGFAPSQEEYIDWVTSCLVID